MIRTYQGKHGKTYGVRVHRGNGRYDWIGSFPSKKEARRAEAQALLKDRRTPKVTVGELVERFMAEYERTRRPGSVSTARASLNALLAECDEHLLIGQFTEQMAETFARERAWALPVVVTMFNYAERNRLVERSPCKGLSRKTVGRRDLDPLTVDEVTRLSVAAQKAHEGQAGRTLAALVTFAAYTGLRPGELYALEWRDIDFKASRVSVRRSYSKGRVGAPKSGKPRLAALLPEARDALLGFSRDRPYVFPAKNGGRLSESLMAGHYWPPVKTAFGRKVDLHELRHFCAHHLYVTKDLPSRVVATQLGHSTPRLVEELYGHFKVGALEEIDRAMGRNVANLQDARETNRGFSGGS